jgi:lysophospholipase L1-like esterase
VIATGSVPILGKGLGLTTSAATVGVLLIALAGCGGDAETHSDGPNTSAAQGATGGAPEALSLVAVGDSIALAEGCDGCTSFVDLWAKGVAKATGTHVEVSNQAVPNAEATDVLDQIRSDKPLRAELSRADLIVVQIGINDTPWNRLDDPCDAAPKYPVIEWDKITTQCIDRVAKEYEQSLDTILAEIEELRGGKPTALRLTTVYNAVLGDKVDPSWNSPAAVTPSRAANDKFAEIQCRLAKAHGGRCVDVYHAFNGADGASPTTLLATDHTHPSPKGHEVIAGLLLDSGTEPVD